MSNSNRNNQQSANDGRGVTGGRGETALFGVLCVWRRYAETPALWVTTDAKGGTANDDNARCSYNPRTVG
jgi:hypothetical protein